MSYDEVSIRVKGVSKHYLMFEKPEDRLKQMIVPRLQRIIGNEPCCYFKDFTALNGISFEVRRGETVGVIGRNGCGKSTLLQVICGTLNPSSGSVDVSGRVAALLELGAGFNPEFSGRENIFMNAAILGFTRAETEARYEDIVRFADIGMFIDQPVKTYSSGMYVRLAFAIAINVDPDILVIDEALSVGDEAFQRKCYARIEDIKDKGATILFVSHAAQTIIQLCDRALLIDRGEIILEGHPKLVVTQYQRFVNYSGTLEETEAVRDTIKHLDGFADVDINTKDSNSHTPTVSSDDKKISNQLPSLEDFDVNLLSESTVEYGVGGARIHDYHILSKASDTLNVLETGQSYILQYFVDFTEDYDDVGYGAMIKAVNGTELGGTGTLLQKNIPSIRSVKKGDSVLVEWEFDCLLNPGVYFCNIGVSANIDQGIAFIHRLVDALIFRVDSNDEITYSGFISFGLQPNVKLVE